MMEVQKYLRDKGLEALKEEFAIKVKEYDDLLVLNYDQINSRPKDHPLICECRGLILDKQFNVVSRAFDRFFNFGENGVNDFDFENSVLLQKLDGSLISVYWHNNQWNLATRGTASGESDSPAGMSYAALICNFMGFHTVKHVPQISNFSGWFESCVGPDAHHLTFIFECVGPQNRIVTPYKEHALVLLAVRNKETGLYENTKFYFEKLKHPCVRLPKKYRANSYEEVMKLFETFDSLDEGVVALNARTGQRIKIKRDEYIRCHRLRGETGTPTLKNILALIVQNETSEFLTYFPEFKPDFDKVELAYNTFLITCAVVYDTIKHIESQKEFALEANKHNFSGLLFKHRATGRKFSDIFAGMHENNQMKYIEPVMKSLEVLMDEVEENIAISQE